MADDEAIERLEKKLNAKGVETNLKRSQLYDTSAHASETWGVKPPAAAIVHRIARFKPLELVFAGSIAFFAIALIASAILFFAGNNSVSTKNVEVQVSGPSQIGAGSTLSLQVVVTNRNGVPMELTDLLVEFPPGTRSASDVSVELPRLRESLGTIQPGESVNRTIRATVFGISGTDFSIKASAEYRVPSSNAILVSSTVYGAKINASPASITVDALKEVVSGQKTTLTVSVASNAPEALKDMLLVVTYPPGFSFDSATPAPSAGKAVWDLGDIEPGGKREVKITGTFSGEDGESRVIHFATGNRKGNQEDEIAAPLATSDVSLAIEKPFISVVLALEGDTAATHAISRGSDVSGTITWTNNLPVRIQNVVIILSLNGQIINRAKVRAEKGFYNSNTSSITWDRSTNSNLTSVDPSGSGVENFILSTLPPGQGSYKNPNVKLSVTVKGDRLSELNVPEAFQSTATIDALVLTDFSLEAGLLHGNQNAGPVPPKAGVETVYTVTWTVRNTGNAVGNAVASGILPPYVVFKGGVVPSAESVTYNESSKLAQWNIGDVAIGGSKSVSFQVGITPSISQVGSAPVIISSQEFSAVDRFVRYNIEGTASPLTTASASSGTGGTVVP
jgi:hypothetical protein